MQTINVRQVASLSALENDFCKLLKTLKKQNWQHEFTDRCAKHGISHFDTRVVSVRETKN